MSNNQIARIDRRVIEKLDFIAEKARVDNDKIDYVLSILDNCLNNLSSVQEWDKSLYDRLSATSESTIHRVMSDKEFPHKLNQIKDDSLIIYVKKAQMYKIYNSDDGPEKMLNDFMNDDNTIYRRYGQGNVYEVVKDNRTQKLVIVINDDVKDNKIEEIKQSIVEFANINSSEVSEVAISDVKVYSDANKTEFLVGSIQLNNAEERDRVIAEFVSFMKYDKNDDIADKIELKPIPAKIRGIRYHKLSSSKVEKQPISKNSKPGDSLVNIIAKGGLTIINAPVVNGPVTVVTGNNNKTKISTNNSKGQTINKVKVKTLGDFCKHIYNDKPDWFKEDKYTNIQTITNAYKEFFNDTISTSASVSRKLKDIIFNDSSRGKNTTKKLVKYQDLVSHFDDQ